MVESISSSDARGVAEVINITNKQEQAKAELQAKIVTLTGKPEFIPTLTTDEKIAAVIDGKIEYIDKPLPRRSTSVQTIDDFAQAIIRWGNDEDSTVFLTLRDATLVIDDQRRIDCVHMPMPKSEAWNRVAALKVGREFTQRELLSLLQTVLLDYLPDQNLIALIKTIKFTRSESGHSVVNAGTMNMSRAVAEELLGMGDQEMPEFFFVEVPVFAPPLHAVRERVRIWLHVNFGEQKFYLEASEDALIAAELAAKQLIRAQLIEQLASNIEGESRWDDSRVLLGTP